MPPGVGKHPNPRICRGRPSELGLLETPDRTSNQDSYLHSVQGLQHASRPGAPAFTNRLAQSGFAPSDLLRRALGGVLRRKPTHLHLPELPGGDSRPIPAFESARSRPPDGQIRPIQIQLWMGRSPPEERSPQKPQGEPGSDDPGLASSMAQFLSSLAPCQALTN